MKITKRILAVLLALVMAAGCMSVAAFAYEKVPGMGADIYMHFGDSTSTGYAMMSREEKENMSVKEFFYDATYDRRVEGTYPDILAHYDGIDDGDPNFHKFAREGLDTDNIIQIVDPAYTEELSSRSKATADMGWSFFTEDRLDENNDTLKKLQEEYKETVKASKGKKVLITVNVGTNDVLTGPVMDILAGVLDAIDGGTWYQEEVVNFQENFVKLLGEGSVGEALDLLIKVGSVVGYAPDALARLIEDEAKGYPEFFTKWDRLISKIYSDFTAAGADFRIVAISYYNATRTLQLNKLDPYHIGRNMGPFTAIFNKYVAEQSPNKDKYLFAYVRQVDTAEWPTLITWGIQGSEFLKDFMYCSHPTTKGHQYIADGVRDVVVRGTSDELPGFLKDSLQG